jgi:hypothetical protein
MGHAREPFAANNYYKSQNIFPQCNNSGTFPQFWLIISKTGRLIENSPFLSTVFVLQHFLLQYILSELYMYLHTGLQNIKHLTILLKECVDTFDQTPQYLIS